METDVLTEGHVAFPHPSNDVFSFFANAVGAEEHRLANHFLKPRCHRPKRISLHRFAFWSPEMRHQYNFRAVLAQIIDRGQALADPRVICDHLPSVALLERHVEIHAHESASPFNINL